MRQLEVQGMIHFKLPWRVLIIQNAVMWTVVNLNFKNTRTIDSNSLLSRSLNGHRNRWPSSSLKHIRLPIASVPKHRSRRTAQPGLCLCASAPFSHNPYEKPTPWQKHFLSTGRIKVFFPYLNLKCMVLLWMLILKTSCCAFICSKHFS